MEAFTDGVVRVSERELERLRDIIGVHMMHGLHPCVRELQQLTVSNAREHLRIEMPGRIQRLPSWSHHVPRMQNHRPRIASPSGVEQQLFDGSLLNSLIAERVSR